MRGFARDCLGPIEGERGGNHYSLCRLHNDLQRIYTVGMHGLRLEWDTDKARSNERKHRVSFEEAQTAFADEQGLLIHDPDHSDTKIALCC